MEKRRKEKNKNWKILAMVGIFGSFLSVMADLFLAFFPQGIYGFETVFTVDLTKVFTVLSQASHWRLLLSNYLAMIGIPLGWAGMYYVYMHLRREGRALMLSRILLTSSAIAYFCGVLFHVSLSYIATAYRLKMNVNVASQQVIDNMIDLFIDFSQPLAYTFQVFIPLISIIFFILVVSRNSRFPAWLGILNPLVIQLIIAAIATFMPLATKTFLTVTIYNFSLLIFYLICFFTPKNNSQA